MKRFLGIFVALTLLSGTAFAQLTFWTTEEQPERLEVQRNIAEAFEAQSGVSVEVVPVTENAMGERVTAAFAAGELPDVIYHPLNFTLSWSDAGILDALSATEVIEALGEDTFTDGALNLVETADGYAAVPVDGWTQLLVYRQDLFDEAGLEPPTSYENVRAALEALHNPPETYGFVAATDPSEVYMMQVFEEVALANGVNLVNDAGEVDVNRDALVQTLEFYKELAEASPPGNLYWQQARELYFAGDAAMIIWSPFILDELAGLRDEVPITAFDDPTSPELANNTGVVTRFSGPNNPGGAGWTDVRYFGITADADFEAAQDFVTFMMSDAYLDTLSIAPEGKFPVRRGTAENPTEYIEGWSALDVGVDRRAPLSEFYGAETIDSIVEGLETGTRWGFAQGQGLLTSRLYDTRVMAELVREYLDDERSAEETADLIIEEVQELAAE